MGDRDTRSRAGRRWPLFVTILLFCSAIAALIAPETLLGEGRDAGVAHAPALGRVSDVMMAAATLCCVLLVLGAIRRSSSPRFFSQIVRFTLALGIAAIVIVAVQIITELPDLRNVDDFYSLAQSGTAKGVGLSATLFLFGCGLVGFSTFGTKPGQGAAWSRPKLAPEVFAAVPAGRRGTAAVDLPTAGFASADFSPDPEPPTRRVSMPSYVRPVSDTSSSRTSPLEASAAPVYAMSTPGKGGNMRDTADKDDGAAFGSAGELWDDGGLAPAGTRAGGPGLPSAFAGAGEPIPIGEDLRIKIRNCIESKPVYNDEAKALLQLMSSHDAGFAAALAKLPERQGIGGAVLAALLRQFKGGIDLILLTRAVSAALVFWPEKGPSHSTIEDLALRLSEFSHDAAREFARAYALLGNRFSLQYSLKVVLQKYGISQSTFDSVQPEEGLTDGTIRGLLGQGRIDLVNEILKPFEIAILEKIGTVVPVYSVIENNHDRYVMNANEFVDLLRRRNVIR